TLTARCTASSGSSHPCMPAWTGTSIGSHPPLFLRLPLLHAPVLHRRLRDDEERRGLRALRHVDVGDAAVEMHAVAGAEHAGLVAIAVHFDLAGEHVEEFLTLVRRQAAHL